MDKNVAIRRIILRADANSFIGLGHVSRLLSIASFLHSDFELFLVSDCVTSNLILEFKNLDVKVISIETSEFYDHPDKKGEQELVWDIPKELVNQAEIIVLDGYWFGSNYRRKCKENGLKTVIIDDFVKPISFADLIINHAPGIDENKYLVKSNCQIASGLAYTMIRPEFLRAKKINRISNNGFVCFGGVDSLKLSAKAATILLMNNEIEKVMVLISSHTNLNTIDALNDLAFKNPGRLELFQSLQSEEVCQLLDKSRYAIVPASTILFEAYFRGCICLCGLTAENQSNIYQGFTKSNYAYGLGDLRNTSIFSETKDFWSDVKNYPFIFETESINPAITFSTLFNRL
jgi:UDP-2,4-diacetamido-2,4,6-trideoxy-beta-L-altropyranose hydrolase